MLKDVLTHALKESGLSARKASTEAGLSPGTLSRWITGERVSPRILELAAVASVLKIPFAKLVDRPRSRPSIRRRR